MEFINSELHRELKEKYYANCIQRELLEFIAKNYEEFESMWFENVEEDFVSNFAQTHNVSFAFDGDLNVNILSIEE